MFGGGIKKDDEVRRLFEAGVEQINLGSIAVKQKETVLKWMNAYGSEKIILSADVKDEVVAIHGWQESSALNILDFIRGYAAEGLTHVVCTDISTDGTLKGPNITLYKKIMSAFPELRLIASGGVGQLNDLVAIGSSNVYGVIVGKAIYEGKISLEELSAL